MFRVIDSCVLVTFLHICACTQNPTFSYSLKKLFGCVDLIRAGRPTFLHYYRCNLGVNYYATYRCIYMWTQALAVSIKR